MNSNKSKFLSDAEKAQELLDGISPSMCLAKWKQVSLHLTTGKTNSCYHPPLHQIDASTLANNPSALHNTPYKKLQRKKMLEGDKPDECSYCWNIEAQGNLSDRHYRSGEPWAMKDFDNITKQPWDQDITPSYVEVDFNHNCNLKCMYCSPQYSTAWEKEIEKEGAYPTSTPHNAPEYFTGNRKPIPNSQHNPYVDAFWKWWPKLYPELEHFRMTGGEPLMDRNTYRVFDYVLQNPKPNLHLAVTSNFAVDQRLWDKYIDYVKRLTDDTPYVEHFQQYVSLDDLGERAEYMRDGLDFPIFWERVNQFLSEVPQRSTINFIITMTNLNAHTMPTLVGAINGLRGCYSKTYQRVWFDTPYLRTPEWMDIRLLPEKYVEHLQGAVNNMKGMLERPDTPFVGFKDYEVMKIQRIVDYMRTPVPNKEQKMADFHRFFQEYDVRRSLDLRETFRNIGDFIDECRYYATRRPEV